MVLDGRSYDSIDREMRLAHPEFVRLAVESGALSNEFWSYIPEEHAHIKGDEELALCVLRIKSGQYKLMGNRIHSSRRVASEMLPRRFVDIYPHMTDALKADRGLLLEVLNSPLMRPESFLQSGGRVMPNYDFPESIKNDGDVMRQFIRVSRSMVRYLGSDLLLGRDYICSLCIEYDHLVDCIEFGSGVFKDLKRSSLMQSVRYRKERAAASAAAMAAER